MYSFLWEGALRGELVVALVPAFVALASETHTTHTTHAKKHTEKKEKMCPLDKLIFFIWLSKYT